MNDLIVKQLVGGMPDLERRLQWWSDQFKFRISQAVSRLQVGKITLAEFQSFGREELRDTYYGIAETGLGRRLTRKEMYQIRTTVFKEQLAFFDRFCQAIADQRQALLDRGLEGKELEDAFNNLYAKFTRRAQSYAGAIEAEGTKWAMARIHKDKSWHQWKLRPAEHCSTCLEREDTIAQMKDGRLPYYPKDGTTLCLYNCLCYWQPISRFKAMALRALGKLRQVFRRKSFGEIVDEYLEKGGPGSGWFAPPRGTHGKGKTGAKKERKRAAKLGSKLKYQPDTDVIKHAEWYAQEDISYTAEKFGIAEKDVITEIEKRLEKDLAKPLAIRRGLRGAMGVATEGRFKTQFETGTSGGTFNPDKRKEAENRGLGIPTDLPDTQRPVYAYFMTDQHRATGYGSVEFVLKDSVKERVTYTLGDSLYHFRTRKLTGGTNPQDREAWDRSIYDYFRAERPSLGISYVEAQIQGGVKLGDVSKVVIHSSFGKRDYEDLIDTLTAKGLKVEVVGTDVVF